MAKAFRKMFAISIMAVLCVLTLCAPVALADADESRPNLYFEGGAPLSELVVILDEEVPLADAPATGDISAVWALMSFVSVGGVVLMGTRRK